MKTGKNRQTGNQNPLIHSHPDREVLMEMPEEHRLEAEWEMPGSTVRRWLRRFWRRLIRRRNGKCRRNTIWRWLREIQWTVWIQWNVTDEYQETYTLFEIVSDRLTYCFCDLFPAWRGYLQNADHRSEFCGIYGSLLCFVRTAFVHWTFVVAKISDLEITSNKILLVGGCVLCC